MTKKKEIENSKFYKFTFFKINMNIKILKYKLEQLDI